MLLIYSLKYLCLLFLYGSRQLIHIKKYQVQPEINPLGDLMCGMSFMFPKII